MLRPYRCSIYCHFVLTVQIVLFSPIFREIFFIIRIELNRAFCNKGNVLQPKFMCCSKSMQIHNFSPPLNLIAVLIRLFRADSNPFVTIRKIHKFFGREEPLVYRIKSVYHRSFCKWVAQTFP